MPVTAGAEGRESRTILGGILTLGLFALWIIGLVEQNVAWLVWCTFAAACAMAFAVFGGGARTTSPRHGA